MCAHTACSSPLPGMSRKRLTSRWKSRCTGPARGCCLLLLALRADVELDMLAQCTAASNAHRPCSCSLSPAHTAGKHASWAVG